MEASREWADRLGVHGSLSLCLAAKLAKNTDAEGSFLDLLQRSINDEMPKIFKYRFQPCLYTAK